MSAVAEKAGEVVEENMDEVIDGTVEVLEVVKNNPKVLIAVGIVGVTVGAVGGYFYAKKTLTSYYEDLSTQEIQEAKEFYAAANKVTIDGTPLSPKDVLVERHGAEAAAEALRDYQGQGSGDDVEHSFEHTPHDQATEDAMADALVDKAREMRDTRVELKGTDVEGVTEMKIEKKEESVHVFSDDTFDLEEEMKYRTEDAPYIITHEEFYAAEKDYDTQSLTYFAEDDVLVDERSKPMEGIDAIVGEDHLVRFGSGSKDKRIVHVRNDRLETEYEITKSDGSYVEEVLGMLDEPGTLKHSNRNAQLARRREFRHGDG